MTKSRYAGQLIDRLLADRIVLLTQPIDDEVTHYLLAQLLFLMDRDNEKPIALYIDSPGGSLSDSLAIIDTIVESSTPVHTTCVGYAAGTALLVLACGTRGTRGALPHAEMQMISVDLPDQGRSFEDRLQLKRVEDLVVSRFAVYSRQPEHRIRVDVDADTLFYAHEAREYGLIDYIVKV